MAFPRQIVAYLLVCQFRNREPGSQFWRMWRLFLTCASQISISIALRMAIFVR